MIDKGLSNEIAQCKLMISDAESLHFYRSITRFIKYGSECNFRCSGGSYKLLKGYPSRSLRSGTGSSRQMVKLTSPSPNGEGFFLLFYLLLYKKIVFLTLIKVDGQVSRGNRDKCPEHSWIST